MYGKIFASMFDGSLYGNWKAIVTFQQMIILCNQDGVVDMTPQALAARTSIPLDIIQEGLAVLEAPDKYSRSREHDGRRIERLDDDRPWGWRLINYRKYRLMVSAEEKREADRARIAAKRAAEKAKKSTGSDETRQSQESQKVANVAQAEVEAEAVKEKEDAANAAVVDVWRYGVDLLAGVGMTAAQARTFVGKLCRDWGEADVHDALMAATGKADPRSYARKWLEGRPKKGEAPPGVVFKHGQPTIGGFVA
jgi:hypothetical protein